MISIERITLAATKTDEMMTFYNAVLNTNLHPIESAAGFYKGTLADYDLTMCPNSVADVNAEQNRQQFCG